MSVLIRNAHDISSGWNLGLLGGHTSVQLDASSGYVGYVNGTNGDGSFTTRTPGLIVQKGTFNVTGTSLSAAVGMDLSTHLAYGMDVAYTSVLHFDYGTEVSMTSSSGVFGTKAVPEPSGLLAASLGVLAMLVRRRRVG